MKVIVAGFSKTGTKSISNALAVLNYNVYDYMEHGYYHRNEWNKILTTGGTVDDFKRMYEDVDAVVDLPTFFFWEQIHQAFPDALIILTIRDEESWFKSWKNQMDMMSSDFYLRLVWTLSPLGWSYRKHFNAWSTAVFGSPLSHAWSKIVVNQMMMINRYRMHNDYVLKHAPKDKLLVFDVRDGWEPLCKFLAKEIPEVPFPHKNIGGSVVKLLLKENEIMKKLNRHTMVAGAMWLGVGGVAIFFLGRSIMRKWNVGATACFNVFRTT